MMRQGRSPDPRARPLRDVSLIRATRDPGVRATDPVHCGFRPEEESTPRAHRTSRRTGSKSLPGAGHRPSPRPPPRCSHPAVVPRPDMTVLLSIMGLLAVVALTVGTAISVASEFALTALERSQVDAH